MHFKTIHSMPLALVILVITLGTGNAAGSSPAGHPTPSSPANEPYTPPTVQDRLDWFAATSFGPLNLVGGGFISAVTTAANQPPEWGGTWEGFSKRFGTFLGGTTMSHAMEAGLGTIWGEDPRYLTSGKHGFWSRTSYALKTSVLAYNRSGRLMPAYARYIGTVGNNFIVSTWLPPSNNGWQDALESSGYQFLGRFASNMFIEFWPEVAEKLHLKRPAGK